MGLDLTLVQKYLYQSYNINVWDVDVSKALNRSVNILIATCYIQQGLWHEFRMPRESTLKKLQQV